jgi:hypothetical protein
MTMLHGTGASARQSSLGISRIQRNLLMQRIACIKECLTHRESELPASVIEFFRLYKWPCTL